MAFVRTVKGCNELGKGKGKCLNVCFKVRDCLKNCKMRDLKRNNVTLPKLTFK